MEHTQYQSRVEEARNIKRRTRRDQVRLMLLIKEADQAGRLEAFANDIDMALKTTGNYLAAYAGFQERGLLPEYFSDADHISYNDEVVHELWGEIFDYTLNTQRYGAVDRDGVKEAAEDMGLQGFGKAMDIAKNPKSMTAAILGDPRAAVAALDAVITLAQRDPLIASSIRERTRTFPRQMQQVKEWDRSPSEVLRSALYGLDHATDRLIDTEVPQGMEGLVIEHLAENRRNLDDHLTVLKERSALNSL